MALSPVTGKPEPLALDAAGKGVKALATYAVEERAERDGGVVLTRREVRGPDAASLAAAAQRGAWGDAVPLALREPGLAIFDGGSYSRGPLNLLGLPPLTSGGAADREALERLVARGEPSGGGDDEPEPMLDAVADGDVVFSDDEAPSDDEDAPSDDEDAPTPSTPDTGADPDETVSTLETCLAWGGEARLRVTITLAASDGGDELGLQPLRIVAARESWQCLPGGDVAACALPAAGGRAPVLTTGAASPVNTGAALAGEWKCFDVVSHALSAAGGSDDTLDADAPAAAYATSSSVQRWTVPTTTPPGDGGGAYCVPDPGTGPASGPALVEIAMVAPVSRGAAADASEGMDAEVPRRGLLLTVAWAPRDGNVIAVQREYDGGGDLVEVRCRAAVRADVAGGSM